MERTIAQRDLRNDGGEIVRVVDAGETFVVTRNGVPVRKVTPLRRRRFVAAETALTAFAGAAPVDPGRFQADVDTVADQDPAPRGRTLPGPEPASANGRP